MNSPDAFFEDPDLRSLALFTPVGRNRARVFAVLLEFAEGLQAARVPHAPAAQRILNSIARGAVGSRPSIAHAIGECLGLIDAWLTSGPYARLLSGLPLFPFVGEARELAYDLQGLGRSGRAFVSIRPLLERHAPELVRDGALLLAASSVLAVSKLEHVDLALAFARLLEEEAPGPAASGRALPTDVGSRELMDFEASLVGMGDPHAAELAAQLADLLGEAGADGLRLHAPGDCGALLEVIEAMPDELTAANSRYALHSYVHYRLREVDPHSDEWEAAHALFPEAPGAGSSELSHVFDAIDEAGAIPRGDLRSAVAGLQPVAAVPALLRWIGISRHTTAAGALQRGDIAEVAAMLGVDAKGVVRVAAVPRGGEAAGLAAHDPAPGAEPLQRIYARSMWGVPALGHWWVALQSAGAIEVTATRVRPGPAVSRERGGWLDGEAPARLCVALIAEMLSDGLRAEEGWASDATMHVLERVVLRAPDLLRPGGYRERLDGAGATVPPPPSGGVAVGERRSQSANVGMEAGVTRRIRMLLDYGFAEERDGGIVVPPLLRGIVGQGILCAIDLFAREIDDDDATA